MPNPTIRLGAAAAIAAASLFWAAAPASAWSRNAAVSTPRGTYTAQGSGYCGYGACQRSGTVTGPYGGTVNHSGHATRTGTGAIQYGGTTTGPNGGMISRSGTVSRY